jgi:hypothetical protein
MDLDTLIYIIATIIIFVVSLLGQNKNKKNKSVPVEHELDEIVYSLNDFEKILQRKEEFRQAHEMKRDEAQVEEQNELFEQDDYKHSDEHIDSQIIEQKEEVKQKENIEEKEDGFDLNSAIIYSSILERKKFKH